MVRELATTGDDLVLVAEWYSGVVALHVAATLGTRVRAVVLVASFVANPTPVPRWVANLLPDWAFRRTLPRWLLRFVLLGWEAPGPVVEELSEAIRAVEPAVLAARVGEVIRLRADEAPRLERTPVLYVRAAHDRLVSARALDAVRARCERVEVREIEGRTAARAGCGLVGDRRLGGRATRVGAVGHSIRPEPDAGTGQQRPVDQRQEGAQRTQWLVGSLPFREHSLGPAGKAVSAELRQNPAEQEVFLYLSLPNHLGAEAPKIVGRPFDVAVPVEWTEVRLQKRQQVVPA